MILHKIKLEAVIGLIYLFQFTRRSPSVTLKICPNAAFTGLFSIRNWLNKATGLHSEHFFFYIVKIKFRRVKRANKQKNLNLNYRNIPKRSPGAYIFQRPFLRGLFLVGLIYGGKFAFQNRLGLYFKENLRLKIHWACL